MKSIFSLMFIFALSFVAVMAQTLPSEIPAGGDVTSIVALLLNYKVLGPVGLGAAIVLAIVQLLKSDFFGQMFKDLDPKIKRLLITVLGVVYGIVFKIYSGGSVGDALVVALFSSGGAVAIYEAIAPFLKKA